MNLPSRIEDSQNLSLNDFPKSLRKLGQYMLNNDEIMTVTEAIKKGNFNYDSVTTIISRERKKGKDFKLFMNNQLKALLNRQKLKVAKALIKRAVSDSHMDRKLYFQLTNDLQEGSNINVNILTVGYNINPLPVGSEREKGEIRVQPFIPVIPKK